MDCGMKCVKWLMFVFNALFWILGVLLLVIGIMSRTKSGSWKELVADTFMLSAANILIAAGVIVALIGFLGCCGACQQNNCMLISYAICIILIFILELGGAIYAYTKKDKLQSEIKIGVTAAVAKTYGNDTDITVAIDWLQKNVECCGTYNATSWRLSTWFKKDPTKGVPESCCIKQKNGCNIGKAEELLKGNTIYKEGCLTAGERFVKDQLYKVAGAAIGIGVVQLLGIIFACCLCNTIKNESS